MKKISIAKDFSRGPWGRYRTDGLYSGEVFREDVLLPALKKGEVLVNLDETEGYGPSFLEEAFGGLIRRGLALSEIQSKLTIEAKNPDYEIYKKLAWEHIEEAANIKK